ncbi:MAG: spore coat protein [Solirubrobacterales bacterium]|nr:spore coat protein [Solirubrobacterales bacterium]
MRVLVVIQARMGSERLPGKVLMTLVDKPVIQSVYERASRIRGVHEVVVATTTSVTDDPLAHWCEAQDMPVYRGSEEDVLERYVKCAQEHDADAVVRITADCPLLDPIASGDVLEAFLDAQPCAYASNTQPPTFPDGLDTEVISREALEISAREADRAFDREHVTTFVREHPERFSSVAVLCETDLSEHRWTLDELRDLTFLAAVVERLRRVHASGSMSEILEILAAEPGLSSLNAGIARNAGGGHAVTSN